MMPGMNLSRFPQVVVGARISASGNATPQAGDLQGLSEPLAPTADTAVSVAISEVVGQEWSDLLRPCHFRSTRLSRRKTP